MPQIRHTEELEFKYDTNTNTFLLNFGHYFRQKSFLCQFGALDIHNMKHFLV